MSKAVPPGISEYMRKIGKKGGKAKLKTLTPAQRSEIARKAGKAGGRGRKKKAE
jgi:general stress protein YciG